MELSDCNVDVKCEERANQADHKDCETKTGVPVVRSARALSELEDLRRIWNSWCGDPDADLDFYVASAGSCPDFVRPHIMVVYREGRPDCMLVGRLERRRLKLKVGYVTLFRPLVSQLFFLRGGFLGNTTPANCRLLAREIKRCLQHKEADIAELAGVKKNSDLAQAVKAEFNSLCLGHFTTFHEHRWLEFSGSFDEFLRAMPRRHRHEYQRHQRKLFEHFSENAYIRCYRREEELDELVHEVDRISAKTYQRALGVGFQRNADTVEFLRSAAQKRRLRAYVLYLDNQPCAFFIGNEYKKSFYGNFMGFDPLFQEYSPGFLVLMRSIEECLDPTMRLCRFDLGWGDREFKRVICNHSQLEGSQYVYAMSWTGVTMNLLRSATSLLDLTARRLVMRSRLLQRVKKLWQARQICNRAPQS